MSQLNNDTENAGSTVFYENIEAIRYIDDYTMITICILPAKTTLACNCFKQKCDKPVRITVSASFNQNSDIATTRDAPLYGTTFIDLFNLSL